MYYLPYRGDYMAKDITITKKNNKRGEDGYKIVSVRMKDETIERLDKLSAETNRSRNELINFLVLSALDIDIVAGHFHRRMSH